MADDEQLTRHQKYYREHKEQRAAYQRERYKWLTEHGICYMCGNADAVHGKLCGECRYKQTIASDRVRTPEYLQKDAARNRARRIAHKAAGLCIYCSEPAAPGRVQCERHIAYQKKKKKESYARRKKWKDPEACRWCDKPRVEGKSFCEEHLKKSAEVMLRNRQKAQKNNGEHRWRKGIKYHDEIQHDLLRGI